jgi:exopolysaccharide biosynthesis polyprenyl glycosylphosphotransferase
MLSRREQKLWFSLVLTDGLLSGVALLLAAGISSGQLLRSWAGLIAVSHPSEISFAAALAAFIAPVALHRSGAYASTRPQGLRRMLGCLARGSLVGALVLLAFGSAFRLESLNVDVVVCYAAIHLAVLTSERIGFFAALRKLRRYGYNLRTFVVLGSGARARQIAERVAANPGWGMRNVGFLDDEPRHGDVELLGDRYLGKAKGLGNLLKDKVIDEVIIALPRQQLCADSTAEAVTLCEAVGVDVTVAAELFDTHRARVRLHGLLGVPALTLSSYQRRSLWALAVKRTIDLVGGLVGCLFLLLVLPLVALAIKIESPGPVFYIQRRCGLNGRTFPFFKFRTMHIDADARLEELRRYNEVTGPVFKMKNDPRVTRVGRFLRKYSLDEMPQLANVLFGQMSLVGPRPPIPGEVSQYELAQRRRLSVRPGLTCLWQVSGRSLIAFEEWVRLDLEYIDRWSLLLDLRILLATIPAVLKAKGAA